MTKHQLLQKIHKKEQKNIYNLLRGKKLHCSDHTKFNSCGKLASATSFLPHVKFMSVCQQETISKKQPIVSGKIINI